MHFHGKVAYSFAWLLERQNTRDLTQIARHLDISVRTLERYKATDHAPAAVMLALYQETYTARHEIATNARNGRMLALSLVRSLKDERRAMRVRMARLESEIEFLQRGADERFTAANLPNYATG